MPQKELKFDKNEFTIALFRDATYPLNQFFAQQLNILMNAVQNNDRNALENYQGPKTDEKRQEVIQGILDTAHNKIKNEESLINTGELTNEELILLLGPTEKSVVYLYNTLFELYSNPNGEFAKQFFLYWNFISPIMKYSSGSSVIPSQEQVMMILNKLNIFNDEAQYVILKRLFSLTRDNTKQQVLLTIAQHPLATTFDKYLAASEVGNVDIARDTIELIKADIAKEMSKDFPDTATIKDLCSWAYNLANIIESVAWKQYPAGSAASWKREEYEQKDPLLQYARAVRAEFNIEKILELGTKYIPQVKQSLEERAIQAEARARSAEQRANQAEQSAQEKESKLQANESKAKQEIETERQKSAQFAREMDQMQQLLDKYEAFIKNLKIKIGSLKVGLFSKGTVSPEQLQEWIKTNVPQETR